MHYDRPLTREPENIEPSLFVQKKRRGLEVYHPVPFFRWAVFCTVISRSSAIVQVVPWSLASIRHREQLERPETRLRVS